MTDRRTHGKCGAAERTPAVGNGDGKFPSDPPPRKTIQVKLGGLESSRIRSIASILFTQTHERSENKRSSWFQSFSSDLHLGAADFTASFLITEMLQSFEAVFRCSRSSPRTPTDPDDPKTCRTCMGQPPPHTG